MDLRAVKAATRPELVAAAVAAAKNAEDLVRDAEILAQARSAARAYSLAALAVEEIGKAASLTALAIAPGPLRARAPIGRMLEWHQFKQVAGQLIAVAPYGAPGVGAKLLAMHADDLAQALSALEVPAEEADRLKRGGLYVDIDWRGWIREPSQITEADVTSQLARARLAVGAVRTLHNPEEQARLLSPSELSVEFSRAVVDSVTGAGYARTPDAAADVIMRTVSTLWERMAGTSLCGRLAA